MLFNNICKSDFKTSFNLKLIIFVYVAVISMVGISLLAVILFCKENKRRGVISQAVFRSNYLLFGIPICERLFGSHGAAVPSVIAAFYIPLINLFAVVALDIFSEHGVRSVKSTLKKICTNPLIIAGILGNCSFIKDE